MNRDEFLRERNEALLSLDEEKIRAYAHKCGAALPDEPEAFWRSVHKIEEAIQHAKPEAAKQRQDVCSLAEGEVSIRWPMSLSQESYDDLTDWLDVMKRKIGRSVTDQYKTPASESDVG